MKHLTKTSVLYLLLIGLLAGSFLVGLPEPLRAYGGPGSIVSGIGALIAAIVAVLAAIFGFVWFPIKRLFFSSDEEAEEPEDSQDTPSGKQ